MIQYANHHRPRGSASEAPDVSIVVPMLNEEDNVVPLFEEIRQVMDGGKLTWEVIFVDDGSYDRTVPRLREAIADEPRAAIIELTRRFGQTAALAAGFRDSRGRFVVPLDADLQNDPRDIPRLIEKAEREGLDVVSGWRKNRQDRLWTRRVPSIIANRLVSRLTWTNIHDFGCTLKAYRREALEDVQLYGEMHRFLPAICQWRGARVAEVIVNHRPRTRGVSKYGMRRTIKVLLDLATVKFLGDYLSKPIYFFGKIGLMTVALAMLTLTVAIFQKYGYLADEPVNLNRNVLVLFAMMLVLMAVTFVMMGLLSELLVRIYHESQNITPYRIRRRDHGGIKNNGALPAHVPAEHEALLVEEDDPEELRAGSLVDAARRA